MRWAIGCASNGPAAAVTGSWNGPGALLDHRKGGVNRGRVAAVPRLFVLVARRRKRPKDGAPSSPAGSAGCSTPSTSTSTRSSCRLMKGALARQTPGCSSRYAARGGCRRHRVWRHRRSLRPHARVDAERAPLFDLHRGVRAGADRVAVGRVPHLLGLGMGGEWASGAALVSETWPARASRQSARPACRARGRSATALAALVNWLVHAGGWGWRGVFFVGVLPALFTLWIRRSVEEPEMWRPAAATAQRAVGLPRCSRREARGVTSSLTLMNACTLFALVGVQHVGAGVSVARRPSGRPRPERGDDVGVRGRHAGGHVVRLRDVRLRQRPDSDGNAPT